MHQKHRMPKKIMKKVHLKILFFFFCSLNLLAAGLNIDDVQVGQNYIFRLTNGDIISVIVLDKNTSNEKLALKIKTLIGTTTIFEDEIAEIRLLKNYYRHNHRVYLLPTALPIEKNHFIGNYELGFFYAGAGIMDFASIYAGRSILPFAYPDQEITVANLKFSYPALKIVDVNANIWFGGGFNIAFINSYNKFIHYYLNSTYEGEKSTLTALLFYKWGSKDVYDIRFKNELYNLTYSNGAFGIALGVDTKFSNRNDLHFIGEIWNSDVNNPSNTLILIGLRLAGTKFSADFGLAFITEPIAFPFISFVWTPF